MTKPKSKAKRPEWQRLTYHEGRQRWERYYKGKVRYLGPSGIKFSRRSHDAAMVEWRRIKAEVDADAEQDAVEARAEADGAQGTRHEVSSLNSMADELAAEGVKVSRSLAARLSAEAVRHGVEGHGEFTLDPRIVDHAAPRDQSIGHHAEGFLSLFRTFALNGAKSVSRADNLRRYVSTCIDRTDGVGLVRDRPAADIDAAFVRETYVYLLERVNAGTMSASTASSTWGAFKQLARHFWKEEIIGLPRNLDDRNFSFRVAAKSIETHDVAEVQAILAATEGRTRLYVLLALNIGALAQDISDLHPSEVDLEAGIITRKRSKTQDAVGVPVVRYVLWKPTAELLREHAGSDPRRVLLSASGRPVVHKRMKEDGKATRTDTVRLAYCRAIAKLNRQTNGNLSAEFRRLRRTGATLIGQQFDETLADLWMGHAPTGIAQRHYIAPNQHRLDEAVAWLGAELGVA